MTVPIVTLTVTVLEEAEDRGVSPGPPCDGSLHDELTILKQG